MSVMDIRSELLPQFAFDNDFTGNTSATGAAIDVADFDGGFVFSLFTIDYTDGTYTPAIEEADDSGFSSPTEVEAGRLIGTPADEAISATQSTGDTLTSIGAFGTKRFVRLKITSTIVTTGATILSLAHKKAELSPAVS